MPEKIEHTFEYFLQVLTNRPAVKKVLTVLTLFVWQELLLANELDVNKWTTNYYLNPTPGNTVDAVLTLERQKVFKKQTAQLPSRCFFSQIFKQNPDSIDGWYKNLSRVDDVTRAVIWQALWLSETVRGKKNLEAESLAQNDSTRKLIRENYLEIQPPVLSDMKFLSPTILDMLWASFFATGEEKYVKRIIPAVISVDSTAVVKNATAYSADWSLKSNCVQHVRVLEICRKEVAGQLPADVKAKLLVIIEKAEAELRKAR